MPDQDSSTRLRAAIIELFTPMRTSARTTSRTTMTMIAISMREELTARPPPRGIGSKGVLVLEQKALQLRAAAVVADIAACADDPVAGHDDRNRIGSQRGPGGTERPRAPGPLGRVGV